MGKGFRLVRRNTLGEAGVLTLLTRFAPTEAGKTPRTNARLYSMLGRIEEASCSANQALDVTLTMGGTRMRLHSDDVTKINFFSTTWKPPANFNPCVHLRGLTAVVSYRLAKDQSFDGVIWSIEIRR